MDYQEFCRRMVTKKQELACMQDTATFVQYVENYTFVATYNPEICAMQYDVLKDGESARALVELDEDATIAYGKFVEKVVGWTKGNPLPEF